MDRPNSELPCTQCGGISKHQADCIGVMLDDARAEVDTLRRERDEARARLVDGTSCFVGLEADGGFPCRDCLPCLRRERDEARAGAVETKQTERYEVHTPGESK